MEVLGNTQYLIMFVIEISSWRKKAESVLKRGSFCAFLIVVMSLKEEFSRTVTFTVGKFCRISGIKVSKYFINLLLLKQF